MATITAATRANHPDDAWLDGAYARAKEQVDTAVREDFAAPGTREDAVTVLRRQRRGLR
jgi:hypothetical protein